MWKSVDFWVAVAVAVLVKMRTSRNLRPWQATVTIAIAVGAAWAGTPFLTRTTIMDEPVAAALLALTAEGGMRWILRLLDDPREAVALWRLWRGK